MFVPSWYFIMFTDITNIITPVLSMHCILLFNLMTACYLIMFAALLLFVLIMYCKEDPLEILLILVSHFAVCSLSPTEVLSELIQSPRPHCSSPSRFPPVSRALCGFLVDWQKGGSLQFHIAFSGKKSIL